MTWPLRRSRSTPPMCLEERRSGLFWCLPATTTTTTLVATPIKTLSLDFFSCHPIPSLRPGGLVPFFFLLSFGEVYLFHMGSNAMRGVAVVPIAVGDVLPALS